MPRKKIEGTKKCALKECGHSFKRHDNETATDWKARKYCSSSCAARDREKKRFEQEEAKLGKKRCKWCQTEFSRKKMKSRWETPSEFKAREFCSKECRQHHASNSGQKAIMAGNSDPLSKAGKNAKSSGSGHVRTIARQYTSMAMDVLVESMHSDDEKVRLQAAQAVLDRGWGKPTQDHTHSVRQVHEMSEEELLQLLGLGPDYDESELKNILEGEIVAVEDLSGMKGAEQVKEVTDSELAAEREPYDPVK